MARGALSPSAEPYGQCSHRHWLRYVIKAASLKAQSLIKWETPIKYRVFFTVLCYSVPWTGPRLATPPFWKPGLDKWKVAKLTCLSAAPLYAQTASHHGQRVERGHGGLHDRVALQRHRLHQKDPGQRQHLYRGHGHQTDSRPGEEGRLLPHLPETPLQGRLCTRKRWQNPLPHWGLRHQRNRAASQMLPRQHRRLRWPRRLGWPQGQDGDPLAIDAEDEEAMDGASEDDVALVKRRQARRLPSGNTGRFPGKRRSPCYVLFFSPFTVF